MSHIRIRVFLVETGTTLDVDASLDLPVSSVNDAITRVTRVPPDKQVLLLSGGVPLFPEKPLCQYESVSDNTVFLVCKPGVHDMIRPVTAGPHYSEQELMGQVDASNKMPPLLDTVRSRMLLVERICGIDEHEMKAIIQLVFDQHQQHQGWCAMVANLEEVCSGFDKQSRTFQAKYEDYLKMRDEISSLLERMPDVLILLGKIPLLAGLGEESASSTRQLERQDKAPGQLSLYTWMNTQDCKYRVEDVINDVANNIEQMGEKVKNTVAEQIQVVWTAAKGNPEYRCIRGIEDRLFGLDKLTNNAKAIVDMQRTTREGFKSNWSRLENEKDPSILPDLCTSHRRQVQEVLIRHKKLLDLKNKCNSAKKELSNIIQSRLPWLMETHYEINQLNNQLVLHLNLLKRTQTRVKFLQQVERAPRVYALTTVEVVRRRQFSHDFMKWAKGVADESKKEHKKEMHRRRAFTKQCGNHFLQKLFLGFNDHVPKFASETPKDVDLDLPSITSADIDYLSKKVPELKFLLRMPTDTGGSPAALGTSMQQAQPFLEVDPFLMDTSTSQASSTASFITQSLTSPSPSLAQSRSGTLALADREHLSLSYQGGGGRWRGSAEAAAAGGGESKDPLFRSLPQCLSETLTAEVNSAAMSTISVSVMAASPQSQEFTSAVEDLGLPHQQPPPPQQQQPQHPEGGGEGVLLSSGDLEPTKSSDSDIISHESLSEHKPRRKRRSVKGLSDTSPDAETSQEFATADFYFEDSMPSSITDSPPKLSVPPAGVGVVVGGGKDEEQAKLVDELKGEVSALQTKLVGSEEKLASLQSVLHNNVSCLRQGLRELREHVQHEGGQGRQALAEAQDTLAALCCHVAESLEREKEVAVGQVAEEGRGAVEEAEARYMAKCRATEELQQRLLDLTQCITDLNRDLQQQRERHEREAEAQRQRHDTELQELQRQNLLAVEVETDRVRTEMREALDHQESAATLLQTRLDQAGKELAQAASDKEAAVESLRQQWAVERQELQEALLAEKTQAVEQVRAALVEELRKEAESLARKESEQKHAEMEELRTEQARLLGEREEELQSLHRAELEAMQSEWTGRLAAQEADLQSEFDLKLERVKAELEEAVAVPEVREAEVQSEVEDTSSCCDQGTQSDASFVSLDDREMQSEACEVRDHGVQWEEGWGLGDLAVQTDYFSAERGVQNVRDVCDQVTQSERLRLSEQGVQSDGSSSCEQGVQSEASPVSERAVQSEGCEVDERSVQSEGGEVLSEEELQRLVAQAVQKAKAEVSQQYEQLLEEEKRGRERQVAELEERHQRDKEEAVQTCKSAVLAERQINFNEAITKAVKDKDAMIEKLTAQLDIMMDGGDVEEREHDEEINVIRKRLASVKEEASNLKREKQRLESEMGAMQMQLQYYSEQYNVMTASATPLYDMAQSGTEGVMTQSVYSEQEVQMKDQKISELEKKLMETSMTTSVRKEARDKVSILTCNVGDLVLLCLDERHNQYVVFTVGTTLHFLHSDCVDALGLRPAEGEVRKNWVLAEVTEREYCQARKAQNRFKVPVNTKFYRVKAKPWLPKGSSTGS
ncbi:RB1-inducible coiled-coil protein 1-like [Babylonia areolata]|uniref:RB1-inducible coiled-coil protein 1-like n=1 Tax=Babylonia areolata TaxID=304850 RepID=UPI003FCF6CCA